MNARDRLRPADFGRVAVVMGGWSAERPVSLDSGAAVAAALERRGVDVTRVDVDRNRILGLRAEGFDRAWLALHGPGGEDGTVQAAFELQGLPYTGSGVLACAIAMDKMRCKALWAARGIPTPAQRGLRHDSQAAAIVQALGLPLIVKPVGQGSSLGVSLVQRAEDIAAAYQRAARFSTPVMAEQYIAGDEYTLAMLDGRTLPIVRIDTPRAFYDYEAKYVAQDTRFHVPSGLTTDSENTLARLAMRAFEVVGARGLSRLDFILDRDGQPWFLDLNTTPAMSAQSLAAIAAGAAGLDFDELTWRLLAMTATARETDNEVA